MVGRLVVRGKGAAWRGLVTELQLGAEKRVCKLLNRRDRFAGYPPPGVFLQKSVEAIENKGRTLEKVQQEHGRVRKRMKG
jgi:hypothetical protein